MTQTQDDGFERIERAIEAIKPKPEVCDICGLPATIERPATRPTKNTSGYERGLYCDRDAKMFLGFDDVKKPLYDGKNTA